MSAGGFATGAVEVLRISTAGGVDDGKSTLVGRLLHDTQSLFDDQWRAAERASRRLGETETNLALITDGLRAEREQKITIDVAYRYFATRRRKFIIADTPGHVQYTRNMVTGASTSDLAIVLIDASTGVQTQAHRHAFIASLLGIPHIIVAINKMDLVGYSESAYDVVVRQFSAFATRLTTTDLTYIPLSALHGDNVVGPSDRMAWYQGGPLLHRLETVHIAPRNSIDFRFPVQGVVRPNPAFRGYTGTVASGSIKVGEDVLVLPGAIATRIAAIETFDGARPEAAAGDAIVLTTADQIDISRGHMIVRTRNLPSIARELDAYLCWTDDAPLQLTQTYLLRQTTRELRATVDAIEYRIDVDTLHRDRQAPTLALNDIGRVAITAADPVFFDPYRSNPATGGFILVDPRTNHTVAAGIIRGARPAPAGTREAGRPSPDTVRQAPHIAREARERRQGHRAGVVWLTGLPGSGKTTVARAIESVLFAGGHDVILLDGDDLRHGLNSDLGFLPADRTENIRRAGEVARLLFDNGAIVLCAFVSPYQTERARVRSLWPPDRFIEVFVKADIETCRRRDPKGHYQRASRGEIRQFTGVSAPYEEPVNPELVLDTARITVDESAEQIIGLMRLRQWLKAPLVGS